MSYETHVEIADEIGGLDEEWHAVEPDKDGVAIEWYTDGRSQTEMSEYLRDMLKDDFEMKPLDGGTELTYRYYLLFE